jgi:DNA repair exonuclease SbcCD ATPase subunit
MNCAPRPQPKRTRMDGIVYSRKKKVPECGNTTADTMGIFVYVLESPVTGVVKKRMQPLINFKTLRYKNFLSSGNAFTIIDFTVSPTTLVVGHNGAGKSTMLDALSFGLFGKPHRKISKPQLVNSINNKGTVVEVEFTIGKQEYKIVRGIKPNIFEIWVGGNMMDQSSHSKEYQQILEKNILKLTHKSFHQIVVLGSSSFVPFMQLSSGARREVIEDLLDINIFSKMNSLLKEKVSILKENMKNNSHEIEICKTKINAQKKYLRELSSLNSAHRKEKEEEINRLHNEIISLNDFNEKHMSMASTELEDVSNKLESLNAKKQKLIEFQSTFKSQIKGVVRDAKFFEENEHCPTCDQAIAEELRETKKSVAYARAKELNNAITKSKEEMEKYEEAQQQLKSSYETARDLQNAVHQNQQTISRLQRDIDRIKSEIEDMSDTNSQFADANEELEILNKEVYSKQDEKYVLSEQYSYYQVSSELLRDTGIKTKIIKQYIPVINKLTNQYLQTLDFFVHFDLDESFNETIRSRHRDNFSYDSFSEGEKQRIDLSLLFTWRQVAKMKNSVATNLLILDETFDSSLDDDGVDNLMKILYSLGEETNVFVISHKSELEDAQFQRKLEFVKEKNFSKLKAA